MEEKTVEQELAELKGHHEGVMASLTMLQSKLDEALQREVDTKAAHDAEIAKINQAYQSELKDRQSGFEAELDTLRRNLEASHASEIADLKKKVLVPALQDMHNRQAADLAAKHAQELEALK